MTDSSEFGTTERIALTTWLLSSGHSLKTSDVAQRLEISRTGAYKMLDRMSRAIPLILENGFWRVVDE